LLDCDDSGVSLVAMLLDLSVSDGGNVSFSSVSEATKLRLIEDVAELSFVGWVAVGGLVDEVDIATSSIFESTGMAISY
jgi:hypothetical protein